ncbi:MAG: hypothetical protein ACKO16_11430 [Gemmataceae bacterium]
MRSEYQKSCIKLLSSIFWICLIAGKLSGQTNDEITRELSKIDSIIIKENLQDTVRNQDWDEIRIQTKKGNTKSSDEWNGIKTKADWQKYSQAKIANLKSSLGKFPEESTQINFKVFKTLPGDGYTIDCLAFESRPGLWVSANLYRPSKKSPGHPGIIICSAHHTPKENGELQDMGAIWARAGCLVLVPDNLGHGERRQHPFDGPDSFSRPFRLSRQDYYFRYDIGIQLQLLEESLMGWMYWDIHRGVDLLLAQKNIARNKIVLLGAVAGGGDPAAVTGALDHRIAVVAPFNFGGPQPETKYPLPPDAETSFNYAGGGSWESTRNLRLSLKDGFLPWVIVGSIAPRKLIYGHEFSWDQANDPVWKRLQKIYHMYESSDAVGFTTGKGSVKGSSPEDTHCTHIGRKHRQNIHVLLEKWLDIREVTDTPIDRLSSETLKCFETKTDRDNHPVKIQGHLERLAGLQVENASRKYPIPMSEKTLESYKQDWINKLGPFHPTMEAIETKREVLKQGNMLITKVLLETKKERHLPLILLENAGLKNSLANIAIMVSQGGKKNLLENRQKEIASLLEAGFSVCLPDIRGSGELKTGSSRGRTSSATSLSSSLMMSDGIRLSGQLRDLQSVLGWLKKQSKIGSPRFLLWGDSPAKACANTTDFNLPRDDDSLFPTQPEPMGGLLALLGALFNDEIKTICVHGGLASYASVLEHHLVQIPHETVVPGIFNLGDLALLANSLAKKTIFFDQMVDGLNREISGKMLEKTYTLGGSPSPNMHFGKASIKNIMEYHLK